MGSNLLKGTFIGGVVAWLWLTISWTMLPWHCETVQEFANNEEVARVISDNTTESGIYLLPNFCAPHGMLSWEGEEGPVIFAAVRRFGLSLHTPLPYILSLFIQCLGAFFVTLILLQARNLAYGRKVLMTILIGVTGGVIGHLPAWNWWGFPLSFVFLEMIDLAIAWFLAGLIIAACVRRKKGHHHHQHPHQQQPPPPESSR